MDRVEVNDNGDVFRQDEERDRDGYFIDMGVSLDTLLTIYKGSTPMNLPVSRSTLSWS